MSLIEPYSLEPHSLDQLGSICGSILNDRSSQAPSSCASFDNFLMRSERSDRSGKSIEQQISSVLDDNFKSLIENERI
jgi:hypothetical protein